MKILRAWRDVRTIARLLKAAEAEARRDGSDRPGPEHLVLAALTLPDGTAARALARLRLAPEDLRAAVVNTHVDALRSIGVDASTEPPGPPGPAPTGPYRLTDPGRQVFQDAVALAKGSGPTALTGAHVVAAGCRLGHGTLALAIRSLGVDRDDLAAAARAETSST
jgi:ATP-dependent Clp protease ATP-binding subunit ClpA